MTEKITKAKSIVFTAFNGLTAKEGEELRKELKKEDSEYYVVKKTLLDLALRENKIETVKAKEFGGRVAAVFGYADEVAPAKIIGRFRKNNEGKIFFLAGILEKRALDSAELEVLAALPSKLELRAKVVGSLNAPLFGFVSVLAGNLRSLVYALKAIGEKKGA